MTVGLYGLHMLTVSPMMSIPNQLVGAQEGQQMTLECHSEAYPKSINYWTRENNVIIANGTVRRCKTANEQIARLKR